MSEQYKTFENVKINKLFRSINESEVNSLFNTKYFIDVKEGDIIYKSGDSSEILFLIVQGNVKIKFSGITKGKKIVSKDSNEFFGEVEFMEGSLRRSSAVAYTDCVLYKIERSLIKNLIAESFQLLANIEGVEQKIQSESLHFNTQSEFVPSIENEILDSNSENLTSDLAEEEGSGLAWEFDPPEIVETEDLPLEIKKENIPETDFSSWNSAHETPEENIDTTESLESSLQEEINLENDIQYGKSDLDNIVFEEGGYEPSNDNWKESILNESKPVTDSSPEENEYSIRSSQLTADQLHKIIEAAQKVNSNINIDDVLFSIVDAATELTRADRGTLYIVDKEKNELWSKVLIGKDIQEIRLAVGEGIAGWVAQTGEIINLDDVSKDKRFNPEYDRITGYYTKTMICFPIKNKHNENIGVIQLLNSKRGEFSHLDEEILKALTINVALAIDNANLVQQLLKNDRLSSLGKMANFIIQDIKKPILTIKQYVEHVKKKNITPDIRMVLDMLMEQADSIADLVTTTISYSEGKTLLQTHQLSINKTLDEIISMLAEFTESKNVKVFKKYDEDVLLNLDKKELYQCMLQITKNACDAMGNGGNIYYTTKRNEDFLEISIKDNGLGIPESIKDRIFEPFMSQGKKQGVGLGLSIAEKIVKDHGGSIRVESDLGEGADFIISLPIQQKNL